MSSVTNRLLYDPTDANSIAASSSIGAYVLAGTDGDAIGSETLNALEWLRVAGPIIDSSGTEVNLTGTSLDVNVTNALAIDLDGVYNVSSNANPDNVGMIAHVRNATPGDAQQTFRSTGGAASSDDIVAANVYGLDVNSFLMGFDGTTWDRLTAQNTAGALDVHVTNSIDVDDDLANTAIENTTTAVSTTAVNCVASALANRKWLGIANEGNKKGYFGKTGVTAANGFPLHMGMQQVWRIGPSVTPQFIGGTGASSEDYRVIELS